MARLGEDAKQMFLDSLAGKGGAEARAIIEDFSKQMKISVGHLYRLTDQVRLNGRAIRRDAGQKKIEILPGVWEKMKGLTINYDLDAEQVVGLAVLNEWISSDAITPTTYNTWLRAEGISRARLNSDVRPYDPREAESPNQVHQFDTTKCEELHYDRKNNLLTWNPRLNRKNSRGEKPDPIWLYSMVDDHSRAKFAYLFRSENQYNHLNFAYRAWSEKERPTEFPFYGVPRHIYMDRGPVNLSRKFKLALVKLGVHDIPTTPSTWEPYGSRKHGKVESAFKLYKKWMKGLRPRLDAGGLSWEEAQESLYYFLLEINNKKHSMTGAPPFARWLTGGKPQHTPSPELWAVLMHESSTRTVNKDLTISINNHCYRLPYKRPFSDWVDREVEVYWLKDNYERVFAVSGAVEIELHEMRDNIVRPFFSHAEESEPIAVEKARAAAAEQDYSGIKLWATDTPRAAYLPRKGEAFDDKRIAEKTVETAKGERRPSFAPMRYLTKFEAVRELRAQDMIVNSPISPAEKAWLDGLFNGEAQISEEVLQSEIAKLKSQTERKAEEA